MTQLVSQKTMAVLMVVRSSFTVFCCRWFEDILHLVKIEDLNHVIYNRGREIGPALGFAQN